MRIGSRVAKEPETTQARYPWEDDAEAAVAFLQRSRDRVSGFAGTNAEWAQFLADEATAYLAGMDREYLGLDWPRLLVDLAGVRARLADG